MKTTDEQEQSESLSSCSLLSMTHAMLTSESANSCQTSRRLGLLLSRSWSGFERSKKLGWAGRRGFLPDLSQVTVYDVWPEANMEFFTMKLHSEEWPRSHRLRDLNKRELHELVEWVEKTCACPASGELKQ